MRSISRRGAKLDKRVSGEREQMSKGILCNQGGGKNRENIRNRAKREGVMEVLDEPVGGLEKEEGSKESEVALILSTKGDSYIKQPEGNEGRREEKLLCDLPEACQANLEGMLIEEGEVLLVTDKVFACK